MVEPIGLIGTLIAIVQISSKVVSICYEYRRSVKSASREISEILDEVASLRNIVERLVTIAEADEQSSSLPSLQAMTQDNGPLSICLSKITSLKTQLKPAKGWKAKGRALLWPLKQVEVHEHLEVIGRVKGTFQLALSADNTANLIEILASTRNLPLIKDEVSKLRTNLDCMGQDTKFRRIMDWLSAPNLALKHESERQKHIPGSGQWFLEHEAYQTWKHGLDTTIWLNGFTGCGKTVLCAAVIEDISKLAATSPSTVIAYIYFDVNGGYKYDTAVILRTIITQLINQTGSLPKSLIDLYSESSTDDHSPRRQMQLLATASSPPSLEEFERVLLHQLNELQHVFLVLDGLDECEDFVQVHRALQIFGKASKASPGNIHLLATSRYLPEIEDCFDDLSASCLSFEIDKVNRDIRHYVRTVFQQEARLSRWPDSVQLEVETELMAKAQGMFRWAECQLQVLKRCRTPSAIRETLRTLPKSLDDTYSRVLGNIHSADHSLARRLLQWLVVSRRPLRLSELNEALAIDMDTRDQPYYDSDQACLDKRDILGVCSSLVTTTFELLDGGNVPSFDADLSVKLAHSSVKEFLMSPLIRSTTCYQFAVAEDLGNAYLARACMAYLMHPKVFLCASDISKFSLMDYAATSWVWHLNRSNAALDFTTSRDLLWKMFDPQRVHYRNWIRFNNLEKPWRAPDLSGDGPLVSPLYTAALLGLNSLCKDLVQNAVDVNASGGLLGNALGVAAFKGHTETVQTLLQAGASPNPRGGLSKPPLAAAVSQGHKSVVELLLNNGAKPQYFDRAFDKLSDRRGDSLYIAAKEGHIECCKLLLDYGAVDTWTPKVEPSSALHVAILAGHKDIVRLILSKEHKIEGVIPSYRRRAIRKAADGLVNLELWRELQAYGVPCPNAPQLSARVGDREKAQTLLAKESEVERRKLDEQRALSSAARGGHIAIVRKILSRGVDPNMDSSFYNVLSQAARSGSIEIIRMLVEAGADVNPSKDRPLTAAARHGNIDAIRVLLEHSADINAGDYEAVIAATTAGRLDVLKELIGLGAQLPLCPPDAARLMSAVAYGGSTRIVKFFFEQGVNPETNAEEDTHSASSDPILNAIQARCPDIVLALLDGGMKVNRIVQSATPLSKAIRMDDALLALHLLNRGADVNFQKNRAGTTPLLEAINLGMISMVKLLLERQADPNQHGTTNRNQQEFPLLFAAEKGLVDIGRLLLKHGALVDEQDDKGFSALHGAARHSHDNFIKMLIDEYHADSTVRLLNGSMPIHSAAARGNPRSIDIFLKVGIDVDTTNHDGRTPLHWAAEKCQWDNVKLLLDKGARTDLKADGELELEALDLAYIGQDQGFRVPNQEQAWSEEELKRLLNRLVV